ncbi:deoxyguanosinetriphosphate triphosphohydrolase [Trueperella bialowiezensis]|uniref:Deoxyguanosinetriphosphate triphosphohydrolase-like protein n=1 Tax=Trueperella bialowiezensis TaxID=312285 RepID=A0A3S4Z488_9ACTO|nr:deoxyguanosinetriphosphate triphosphohydrolase [Trueperella bialowiezensis]VEI12580.1 Deoxyguanosinetriphosphate triphosphohydrolase [Trueperella bialowiezensis]
MSYSSFDTARWAPEASKSPSRTDFERDRARVLHSSALRRLGAKTQVLGPESNDFIRTRLTHSLEVAQVGRSLAKNLGADQDLVESACLAHDIGHPPFGHNGERALNDIASGIGGFEGNAQTLRILTRLEPKRFHDDARPAGLNLTRAATDAAIKYPWANGQAPAGKSQRKFGFYASDEPAFAWARSGAPENRQCAEAQMMDLADDIAYSVHDLEDSIVRGALRPAEFLADREGQVTAVVESTLNWYGDAVSASELEAAAGRLFTMHSWPAEYSGTLRDLAQLKDLTSDLIGRFVGAVSAASLAASGGEPLTRYNGDVTIPRDTLAEITFLKGLAVHFVMAPRETEPRYYEERSLIMDLVDAIMEDPVERLEPHLAEMWKMADGEDAQLRVVVDQVASLTDQSARLWHSTYCGMLRN